MLKRERERESLSRIGEMDWSTNMSDSELNFVDFMSFVAELSRDMNNFSISIEFELKGLVRRIYREKRKKQSKDKKGT